MSITYSVVGLGKLGASMAAAIASRGFNVIGVDVSQHAVDLLNAGHAPVQDKSGRNHREQSRAVTRQTIAWYVASRAGTLHGDPSHVTQEAVA